jgi:hypothetical protein
MLPLGLQVGQAAHAGWQPRLTTMRRGTLQT